MKKVFALIMTLMMIFAFTACGSQDQEASAATNYETTGTVQEVGNGEITIETQSDEVLTFNIENADIDSGTNIKVDDVVTLYYSGKIENGDTSGCTVLEVSVQPGEEMTMTGTLQSVDEDAGTITIKSDGELYTFDITNAERKHVLAQQKLF